jgi:transposase
MNGYIYTDRPQAVPKTCPKCGRKAVRRGNRHHQEVYCEGFIVRVEDGRVVRDCNWRQTVYWGDP